MLLKANYSVQKTLHTQQTRASKTHASCNRRGNMLGVRFCTKHERKAKRRKFTPLKYKSPKVIRQLDDPLLN